MKDNNLRYMNGQPLFRYYFQDDTQTVFGLAFKKSNVCKVVCACVNITPADPNAVSNHLLES